MSTPLAEDYRPYFVGLDGLRGIAILLIIGYHLFRFIPVFEYGWLGVDLFFVLSGFLITGILRKTSNHPGYLQQFFLRRIVRIFPIYYLTLVIFILCLPALIDIPYDASYYLSNQAYFWPYLSNWLFILKGPEQTFFLSHLWSLAVEEQYYLVWPFFILLLRNFKRPVLAIFALLGVVVFLRILIWSLNKGHNDYGNLYIFSRVDGLLTGSALAVYLEYHPLIRKSHIFKILAGLVLLNALFVLVNYYFKLNMPYFPFLGYPVFAIIFGLIVYYIVSRDQTKLPIIFRNQALGSLGKISYGFYLYHWPLYLLLQPGVKTFLSRFITESVMVTEFLSSSIITIFVLIISIASYFFIEKKFLRLKQYFNQPIPVINAK